MNSFKIFLYKNSVAWSLVLLWVIFIFILSSVGNYDSIAPVGPRTHDRISLVVHLFLYAVLMVLVLLAVISYPERHEKFWHGRAIRRWQYLCLSFFITIFYGFTDEWHQVFTPGRESSLFDWHVDVLGALMSLFFIVWCVRKKIKRASLNKI